MALIRALTDNADSSEIPERKCQARYGLCNYPYPEDRQAAKQCHTQGVCGRTGDKDGPDRYFSGDFIQTVEEDNLRYALAAGFNDTNYFTRVSRRHMGISPSKFKSQVR
jgi:hypothetical protein